MKKYKTIMDIIGTLSLGILVGIIIGLLSVSYVSNNGIYKKHRNTIAMDYALKNSYVITFGVFQYLVYPGGVIVRNLGDNGL